MKALLFWIGLIAASSRNAAFACTNVLVTPGASVDGSAMIAYNADAGNLMGMLYHYPATTGREHEMRKVYEWDTGNYLGEIPEANKTYNVIGNVNEHGLCIGESTFGGVEVLSTQRHAIMDYGSLIWITLQRSTTAIEAIHTMAWLMDTYGYCSEGESFSIADRSGSVWIMEVIGTGDHYHRKGSVWVARRIPDGHVSGHSNHARITTFPRDDPKNCLFSDGVVHLAVHYGLYPADADPLDFSFSDVYNPLDFKGAREGEGRTWSFLSSVADEDGSFRNKYRDYVLGREDTERMPLWIRPYKKLSALDVMHAMANHHEGTELDMSLDVGAGLYNAPYRPRPVEWEFEGRNYHNERPIAVPQTGWNFVAQIRPWMPPELSALMWFGVDDSSTGPRYPVYGGCTSVSEAYAGKGPQDGVAVPLLTMDMSKSFWVHNMVANFAYMRWRDVYPVIREKIDGIQTDFRDQVATMDEKASALYKSEGVDAAIALVNEFSVGAGDMLHDEWMKFYGEIFVRFRDFFEILPDKTKPDCHCMVIEGGLDDDIKKRIVRETGDHYKVLEPSDVDAIERRREWKFTVPVLIFNQMAAVLSYWS